MVGKLSFPFATHLFKDDRNHRAEEHRAKTREIAGKGDDFQRGLDGGPET